MQLAFGWRVILNCQAFVKPEWRRMVAKAIGNYQMTQLMGKRGCENVSDVSAKANSSRPHWPAGGGGKA
jgi:hypothetical protein